MEIKPPLPAPTCSSCGRARTAEEVLDYSPLQLLFGQPLGWYSGSDGELCPDCFASIMSGQR